MIVSSMQNKAWKITDNKTLEEIQAWVDMNIMHGVRDALIEGRAVETSGPPDWARTFIDFTTPNSLVTNRVS